MSKHKIVPTLLRGIQAFHFEMIVETYGCCPVPVAVGESETEKSTALVAALSLFGCNEIGVTKQCHSPGKGLL